MRWAVRNGYWMESDLGYRVSKACFPEGPIYSAWAPREDSLAHPVWLGSASQAEDAKLLCEQHADEMIALENISRGSFVGAPYRAQRSRGIFVDTGDAAYGS